MKAGGGESVFNPGKRCRRPSYPAVVPSGRNEWGTKRVREGSKKIGNSSGKIASGESFRERQKKKRRDGYRLLAGEHLGKRLGKRFKAQTKKRRRGGRR